MRAKVISVVFLSLSFMIASITGCSGKTPAISTVSKQVHKMKGSAANVGGEALRDAAWEVEQAGKAGDMARVARWVSELETQVVRLNEALQQWES
ncbi:MAG: Hpt domain-containing protein [Terracidiphilus sp.]|jgi:HPt (histidine-containing phosphotransfer) domain-containing protein